MSKSLKNLSLDPVQAEYQMTLQQKLHSVQEEIHAVTLQLNKLLGETKSCGPHEAKLLQTLDELKEEFSELMRELRRRKSLADGIVLNNTNDVNVPRAAAVAKFRLLTGHDCLCAHLFRFNLVTSPICVLCDTGQDMTAAPLDECCALNDLNCIVKRYWRARCLMT
ncbi:uncharacterized protein TNCV_1471421 [Trichonephila clavipes]|nr:uncharacterized protein TNCV_1471421 [Trichonephila clavipes]